MISGGEKLIRLISLNNISEIWRRSLSWFKAIFTTFYWVWKSRKWPTHVRITQKVKDVLMWNFQHYFHMKTKILADFQICISASLILNFINETL